MKDYTIKLDVRLLLLAGAVLLAAAVFLVVQSQRGSWPFSRNDAFRAVHSLAVGSTAPTAGATASLRAPIDIEPERMDAIGVRFEPAQVAKIAGVVRATASVLPDESRVSHVHTRVSGWVERLYINTTGRTVRAGEPLMLVFSQELLSSQNEYLSALRGSTNGPRSAVVEAARSRLEVLGMTNAEIVRIERSGVAQQFVTITAPRSGTVLHRGVNAGTSVDPSTELLTIADLSRVWVLAEVPEAAVSQVSKGDVATLRFPASGKPMIEAKVEFVYPTLTDRTRTKRARFALDNTDARLPPGMYGTAEFSIAPREVLTVARDAVVDTGETQHVFVRTAANVLEPRTIRAGTRLGERVEVLEGLAAGEQVVATGVFLIDSESRLRASGGAGHAGHAPPTTERVASDRKENPEIALTPHAGHGGERD